VSGRKKEERGGQEEMKEKVERRKGRKKVKKKGRKRKMGDQLGYHFLGM
jgi:hypothetical protein